MSATIYAGPGKLYRNAIPFFPQDANGQIDYTQTDDLDDVACAITGHLRKLRKNSIGKIDLTPFDHWAILPAVYPTWAGITTGANTGAAVMGTDPHGTPTDVPSTIWNPSGHKVVVARTGITTPPPFHLGVGKKLFGQMQLIALLATGKALGDSGDFHTITESGAADPGGNFAMTTFVRERWTGAWGTGAGFGGDGGTAMEAEDGWDGEVKFTFQSYAVQELVRVMILTNVEIMIKARLFGPTKTQIDAAVRAHVHGAGYVAGNDLVLTSTSGKTVTLKKSDMVGQGHRFGGTKLGIGEVGFVTDTAITSGAPQPVLVFSA